MSTKTTHHCHLLPLTLLLACSACPVDKDTPPEQPTLELKLSQVKQFDFAWAPVEGAQYYQLRESVNGEPHMAVGDEVLGQATSLTVPLHFRVNASYVLRACNEWGCTDSEAVETMGTLAEAVGYFKASNTDADDGLGLGVALSADGSTLAVGAPGEASNATGIDGDQTDNSAIDAGAVYLFARVGQTWTQQAYVKASNSDVGDGFGNSVALSDDGSTLAVGAYGEQSNTIGVDGDQADNSASGAGAAYVYVRDNQGWTQQAYVKASNSGAGDQFGWSVALSGDGTTLAVGAYAEQSNTTGVDGDQTDDSAPGAGAVYVYVRDSLTWTQQAYVKASNSGMGDSFGWSVALSDDGTTLAVGAYTEESNTTGIDGDQTDDSAWAAGAAYVFVRDDQTWTQQAYLKASNTALFQFFGWSVALSGEGNTLAVAAPYERSKATGIDGDPTNTDIGAKGAVYLFDRDSEGWTQQAYVKASNTGEGDYFGWSVALSDDDGSTLAVGAIREASSATGIDGDQTDDSVPGAGAAYVYLRGEQSWTQQAYVKASNTGENDLFGVSVALSGDKGSTLAVGGPGEASNATGVSGNQTNNSSSSAGAVYVF